MATIMRVGGGAGGGKEPVGKAMSSLAVGDIVRVRENGLLIPYRIVHKGLPSDMYDASCNGVWVMREAIYYKANLNDTRFVSYAQSPTIEKLNNEFISLFGLEAKAQIKDVKIPYVDGASAGATVKSGADGLPVKAFILSAIEVGFGGKASVPEDGAKLNYFNANVGADTRRVAYYNGGVSIWWTRSAGSGNGVSWVVNTDGSPFDYYVDNAHGIRPAMVFENSALVTLEPNVDGSYTLLCDAVLDEVGQLPTGDTMLITENGIPTEYYIAKHGYEAELNGPNRTLLRRKDAHSNRQWHSSNVNAYATSAIDEWLNGEFYNSLSAGVRDLIGATAFKYTPGNGNATVDTLERAVFLLSATELGVSQASANIEGSQLPIVALLKPVYSNGSAVAQWTRTPYASNTGTVFALTNTGAISGEAPTSSFGIPPAFTIPSDAKVIGPDNYGRYSLECEAVGDVYGIARDITASSPEWVRTDAAMTFSAKASIGTVAGASDFDNVYPWSEMKRVTLDSGDVMVRIPKFYYGRYRNGNIERIQISGRADVGLTLHPAFNHAGVEQDCIYVGAYKAGIDQTVSSNWKATSKSGVAPMTGGTRQQFRLWTRAKGSGWSVMDISTLSAIQMLYLVEFANNNSQAMVGRGYVDGNTAAINTGSCDTVPNLTGRPAGTDGKTDIVYRGIEGIWGNIWEFVDGINYNSGKFYVCNDPSKYTDNTTTNYSEMTLTVGAGDMGLYVSKMGLDGNGNPHIMIPSGASGSETTGFCDALWTSTSWRVYTYGGNYAHGSQAGLFTTGCFGASSDTASDWGSRLIYIP